MTGKREFLVGKRVTVIGLGIEGVDVARYAAMHGAASVTISDTRPRHALADRLEQLSDLTLTYDLGGDGVEAASGSDVVFVSQSVPLDAPAVLAARTAGAEVTSMTRAFLELCPGPVIGITGSSGKTTTTALTAQMLATAGIRHRTGGNIGVGLLGQLDGMDDQTWGVVEISHTQLQLVERGPHIAALLNVTPNHLDNFSWDEYVELKRRIVQGQTEADFAVLNLDDEISAEAASLTPAHAGHFSLEDEPEGDGAFLRDAAIFVRRENIEEMVLPVAEIPLRGKHNVANVLAATAIASFAGVPSAQIAGGVRVFEAVPHRLEFVAEIDGVQYVNDSIASTPERTLAGIRSFSEPLVLLLGGKDKDLPKDELAQEALNRCSAIVFFGADGALYEAAVEANAAYTAPEDRPQTARVATLAEAVRAAREMASAGEVVLLSPACTSFDAYPNFEARGEEFRRIVRAMSTEGR